jgi:hypothetical protein
MNGKVSIVSGGLESFEWVQRSVADAPTPAIFLFQDAFRKLAATLDRTHIQFHAIG